MMADKEKGGEENTSRGNEWEVVSLTESTYAAAPGPKEVKLKNEDNKDDVTYGEDEAESSRSSLFMSDHFVFPPSQHENLPVEPDYSESVNEQVGKNIVCEHDVDEGGKYGRKDEENWPLKGLNVSDEIPGLQFSDGKAISGSEFEESTTLQELGLNEKEQSIWGEPGLGGSDSYVENLGIPDVNEQLEHGSDYSTDNSHSPKPGDYDDSDLPCEAWWKRRAASLYNHAKETNTFWSIFVAAAVVGLVILGQRWQQERWRALQLKWQANVNEKTGRMLGPISRLKDVIVGGHRRGSFIGGTSSIHN